MAFKVILESVNPVIPALRPGPGETFMIFRIEGGTEELVHKSADVFKAISESLADGKFEVQEVAPILAALLGKSSLEARLLLAAVPELVSALKDGKFTMQEGLAILFKLFNALR